MPPKKKQKRNHPVVEHWTALAAISKNLAALCKQDQQFRALLKQIRTLTNHAAFVQTQPSEISWGENFKYSEAFAEQITSFLTGWVERTLQEMEESRKVSNAALRTLKNIDVSNDDILKKGACLLAEAEVAATTVELVIKKWSQIVRCQQAPDKLKEHTLHWLQRWLSQWEFAHASICTRVGQFKDTYSALDSIF